MLYSNHLVQSIAAQYDLPQEFINAL